MKKQKKHTARYKDKTYRKIELLQAWLPIVISFMAFFFAVFPMVKFYNNDYLEKANAGSVKAQIFLADHYYEVGDYSQSIYWYKIASMHDGKFKAKALNNLAILYLNHSTVDERISGYKHNVYKMFKSAMNLNDVTAARNLYIFLMSHHEDELKEIDVNTEIERTRAFLLEKSEYTNELEEMSPHIVFFGVDSGDFVPSDTWEYHYEMVSSDYIYNESGSGFKCLYIYNIYKMDSGAVPKYQFIS